MRSILLIATLISSLSSLSAREWKSADGDKSFEAEYISYDGKKVTLRKEGKTLTFSIAKLHANDRAWLSKNHPAGENDKPMPAPAPEGAAFDTLVMGDTKDQVTEKLLASQMVESTIAEVMLTRVGINGIFRTKETIGGLHCFLYFGWDDQLKLNEVTLRTKKQPLRLYDDQLKNNWRGLAKLLTVIHGKPVQASPFPRSGGLQDGQILGTHLWRSEHGHSVLLGTSQEGKDYNAIVRITSETIKTNRIR